jgi:hypothetical protein
VTCCSVTRSSAHAYESRSSMLAEVVGRRAAKVAPLRPAFAQWVSCSRPPFSENSRITASCSAMRRASPLA